MPDISVRRINFGKHSGGGLYGNGGGQKRMKPLNMPLIWLRESQCSLPDIRMVEYGTRHQNFGNYGRHRRGSVLKTFTLGRNDRNLVQELKVTVPEMKPAG